MTHIIKTFESFLFELRDPREVTAKDTMRITDIVRKGNGNAYRENQLAQLMANKITDADKAYRRFKAAQDEHCYELARIFKNRYDELSGGSRRALPPARRQVPNDPNNPPQPKDEMRIKDIKRKAENSVTMSPDDKAISLASVMASAITDIKKAYRRYKAAEELYPEISAIFKKRYFELEDESGAPEPTRALPIARRTVVPAKRLALPVTGTDIKKEDVMAIEDIVLDAGGYNNAEALRAAKAMAADSDKEHAARLAAAAEKAGYSEIAKIFRSKNKQLH